MQNPLWCRTSFEGNTSDLSKSNFVHQSPKNLNLMKREYAASNEHRVLLEKVTFQSKCENGFWKCQMCAQSCRYQFASSQRCKVLLTFLLVHVNMPMFHNVQNILSFFLLLGISSISICCPVSISIFAFLALNYMVKQENAASPYIFDEEKKLKHKEKIEKCISVVSNLIKHPSILGQIRLTGTDSER